MARFGASQLHDPRIRNRLAARFFLRVFGTADTSSSRLLFMRTFRRLARQQKIARVLDAGCGRGKYSFWIAQNYTHTVIDACDLRPETIAVAKDIAIQMNVHTVNFFVQDLLTLDREALYDLVFSNHVLEHVPENVRALRNLVRAASPGGFVYVQIPNAIQKRLPLGKLGRKILQEHEEWAKDEHTGQSLTLGSLSSHLRDFGCTILFARYLEGFVGELRFELEETVLHYLKSQTCFAVIAPLLRLLAQIDSRMEPSLGNGILVLARKNAD